jgi:hypothetical protein
MMDGVGLFILDRRPGPGGDQKPFRVCLSVGDILYIPVRHPSPLRFSDVKIMLRAFFCHVREYVVKPYLQQNADTGVFSLGDFWRDSAQYPSTSREEIGRCISAK